MVLTLSDKTVFVFEVSVMCECVAALCTSASSLLRFLGGSELPLQ